MAGRAALWLAAIGLATIVAGCSGIETSPPDPKERGGIPDGPGVLSGEKGKWVILSE